MGDLPGEQRTIDRRELVTSQAGRIDGLLAAAFPDLSRARIQRFIASGHVTVDGEPVTKVSSFLDPGAVLTVEIPVVELAAVEVDFDLPVLYEDDLLLAIDKPQGISVHGPPGDPHPTIAAWFAARYAGLASAFDVERPGIVHRLDKDTTGVLLLAKTPEALGAASRAFELRQTEKTYVAVVDGVPGSPRAVIEAPLGRHPGDRMKMAIVKRGKAARTGYELLASRGGRSLLKVNLETGRTHQARVHLAAVHVPVVGDSVYGKGQPGERQLLHAWRLRIPHPAGGKLTVTSPLPADMAEAVRAMNAEHVASEYLSVTPPTLE